MAAQPAAPPPQIVKTADPREPDEPSLNLIGVVVGAGEGYAVFLDNTSHAIVRLKTGEGEGGWILRSVANREVVLEMNHRTAVMRLPSPMGDHK
jgi:general secretion pathway protein N